MKKILTILALTASLVAVLLSVLPLSNLAYIPAVAALIFGLIAFVIANRKGLSKRTIQLAFLLTIISLSITIYKSIFNEVELGNTEELEIKEEQSVEDSKEILEGLDLDELDEIDEIDME